MKLYGVYVYYMEYVYGTKAIETPQGLNILQKMVDDNITIFFYTFA